MHLLNNELFGFCWESGGATHHVFSVFVSLFLHSGHLAYYKGQVLLSQLHGICPGFRWRSGDWDISCDKK
jgi:hypothetical protein